MIEAFPLGDGFFYLADGYPYRRSQGTYAYKDRIKAAGGRWNPDKKHWVVSEEALPSLQDIVTKMQKARVGPWCHNPEEIVFVTQQEIQKGQHKRSCARCDTSYACGGYAEILEVLE